MKGIGNSDYHRHTWAFKTFGKHLFLPKVPKEEGLLDSGVLCQVQPPFHHLVDQGAGEGACTGGGRLH